MRGMATNPRSRFQLTLGGLFTLTAAVAVYFALRRAVATCTYGENLAPLLLSAVKLPLFIGLVYWDRRKR